MDEISRLAASLALDGASNNTIRQYTRRVATWLESGLEANVYIGRALESGNAPEAKMRKAALTALRDRGFWPPYKAEPDTFPAVRKLHHDPVPYLPPEQARSFFEEIAPRWAESYRDMAALKMYYASGCRQQELIQALRSDFFMEGNIPILRVRGKGGKPREIPLPAWAKHALDEYERYERKQDDRAAVKLAKQTRQAIPDYLIRGRRGGALNERDVQRLVHDCCEDTHMPRPRHPLHMIRSWYATHLLEQGVDVTDLSILMGHSTVKETMPYLLRSPARTRRAVEHHLAQGWVKPRLEIAEAPAA